MTRAFLAAALAVLAALSPGAAHAASFKVIPVKLFLEAKARTTVLKIVNEGDEAVNVQIEAFKWGMDADGKDVLEPAKDLVFFPKMGSIAKGTEKIIRVGYEGKPSPSNEELSYRVIVTELPVSKPGETAVSISLRMSIPVFIKPGNAAPSGPVVERTWLSDGGVKVRIKNTGKSHFMVTKIKAVGTTDAGTPGYEKEIIGWYVLPGAARNFDVPLPKADCLKLKEISIESVFDNRDSQTDRLFVDKGLCVDRPKGPEGPRPPGAPEPKGGKR